MARCYLGVGANLGDRKGTILKALDQLKEMGAEAIQVSNLIETLPLGGPEGQPTFINGVVEIQTDLNPHQLLEAIMEVEERLGRTREIYWGPRTIDLDILAYGELILDLPHLTLPHPHFKEREFVLRPWMEIAPDFIVPSEGKTVAQLWEQYLRVNDRIG